MKKLITILFIIFTSFQLINSESKKAFIIPIHGEIKKSMMVFIKRGIEKVKSGKYDYVVFDIDTFGGRVDSALQITTLIGSIKNSTTIAYVTAGPESKGVSWSAGALISFSCNKIYMAPGTSIGAAAPVYQTNEGMQMAEEKVVSAVRTQMASLAEKNNHPKSIGLAMVDNDYEVLEIYIDGELQVVTREDLKEIERNNKGKVIEEGRIISHKDKLLTLTAKEMEKYKVSSGTYDSNEILLESLGVSKDNIISTEESDSDKLISFLTSGGVMSLLIIIALVAFYIELNSPGFAVPGTIGLISISIIFITNAFLGQAGSLEIILFLAGIVLLILEIFVIPGFGVAGVSGIILIVLSLLFSMQNFVIPAFDWQWNILFKNLLTIILSVIISVFTMLILAQFLPKTTFFFKRLSLNTSFETTEGFTVQTENDINKYLNQQGIATTILRPAGKAEINGEQIEVVTDGEFIEKGNKIEVMEVTSNKVIVRKV